MALAVGVDACRQGWIAITLDDTGLLRAVLVRSLDELAARTSDVDAIAIDIPIGTPPRGNRQADLLARRFIGRRSSSVFSPPHPDLLSAPDYLTANERSKARHGRGISKQAWALVPKMREAALFARGSGIPVFEVHPEVSFTALAGNPIRYPKSTWAGHHERRSLLERAAILLPDTLGAAGLASPDDVLDATAAAWSARRIAKGEASSLPDPPEHGTAGEPVAIWY